MRSVSLFILNRHYYHADGLRFLHTKILLIDFVLLGSVAKSLLKLECEKADNCTVTPCSVQQSNNTGTLQVLHSYSRLKYLPLILLLCCTYTPTVGFYQTDFVRILLCVLFICYAQYNSNFICLYFTTTELVINVLNRIILYTGYCTIRIINFNYLLSMSHLFTQ